MINMRATDEISTAHRVEIDYPHPRIILGVVKRRTLTIELRNAAKWCGACLDILRADLAEWRSIRGHRGKPPEYHAARRNVRASARDALEARFDVRFARVALRQFDAVRAAQ